MQNIKRREGGKKDEGTAAVREEGREGGREGEGRREGEGERRIVGYP